jgi:hypothetical protein
LAQRQSPVSEAARQLIERSTNDFYHVFGVFIGPFNNHSHAENQFPGQLLHRQQGPLSLF